MQVALKSVWLVEMTGQELTLISKGLTGSLSKAERKAAWELAQRMATARAAEANELQEVQVGALKHFETPPDFNDGR